MANVFSNTGSESVNIDGANSTGEVDVEIIAPGAIQNVTQVVSSTSHTIATVPVDKVWQIVAYTINHAVDDGRTSNLLLKFNDVIVDGVATYTSGTTAAISPSKSLAFPAGAYPQLTAGQTIKCTSTWNIGVIAIWYIEVDA